MVNFNRQGYEKRRAVGTVAERHAECGERERRDDVRGHSYPEFTASFEDYFRYVQRRLRKYREPKRPSILRRVINYFKRE